MQQKRIGNLPIQTIWYNFIWTEDSLSTILSENLWSAPPDEPVFRPLGRLTVVLFYEKNRRRKTIFQERNSKLEKRFYQPTPFLYHDYSITHGYVCGLTNLWTLCEDFTKVVVNEIFSSFTQQIPWFKVHFFHLANSLIKNKIRTKGEMPWWIQPMILSYLSPP